MKVLIVDDNEDSRLILRKTLEHEGYSVEEAPNGIEALKVAGKFSPEMIISDVLMPEMDGFRLCRKIKQDKQLRNIPFIFYTSTYTDPKNEKLAMSLGAARYIVKPIGVDEFIGIVKEISSKSKGKKPQITKKTFDEEDLLLMYEESIVEKLDKKVRELQLFKEIFANSNDAIFIMDPIGHIIKQNKAHKALAGYSSEELRKNTPSIYLGENIFSDIMKKLYLMGVYRGDLVGHTKKGRPIHIELSAFSITTEKGKVTNYIGIARDITERKQAEIEIRKQAENLEIINAVISDVSSTLELGDVLNKIAIKAAELINGDSSSIAIYDQDKKLMTYPCYYNTPEKLKKIVEKSGGKIAKRVMDIKRPLVITDYSSGNKRLKEFFSEGLKGLIAVPLLSRGKAFGTLMVYGLTGRKQFNEHDKELLESMGKQAAIAIENASLYMNLEQMLINTITSLASMMDAKSPWTRGHAERVTRYALAIGKKMGLDSELLDTLKLGGLLHDIGKIGTYDVILEKPDALTPEEAEIINQHPSKGAEILTPIKQLRNIVPLVKYHHEKVDGTGYPDGLNEVEIPLLAKILCVADAYDSLTANRPYRKSTKKNLAIEEIKHCTGTHFDPSVVNAFLKVMETEEN